MLCRNASERPLSCCADCARCPPCALYRGRQLPTWVPARRRVVSCVRPNRKAALPLDSCRSDRSLQTGRKRAMGKLVGQPVGCYHFARWRTEHARPRFQAAGINDRWGGSNMAPTEVAHRCCRRTKVRRCARPSAVTAVRPDRSRRDSWERPARWAMPASLTGTSAWACGWERITLNMSEE